MGETIAPAIECRICCARIGAVLKAVRDDSSDVAGFVIRVVFEEILRLVPRRNDRLPSRILSWTGVLRALDFCWNRRNESIAEERKLRVPPNVQRWLFPYTLGWSTADTVLTIIVLSTIALKSEAIIMLVGMSQNVDSRHL
jgi:hypothetical protein